MRVLAIFALVTRSVFGMLGILFELYVVLNDQFLSYTS